MGSIAPASVTDFPEDVQACILSFLSPADLQSLAATCKRFLSLYEEQTLWSSMCQRRWGAKTQVERWANLASHRRLYGILHHYERLVGFWRHVDRGGGQGLVFFEWGPHCITGSRVTPSQSAGYAVHKEPFFWMGMSREGRVVGYVEEAGDGNPNTNTTGGGGLAVRVSVGFIGDSHVVLEEDEDKEEDGEGSGGANACLISSSPPEQIYQYFANKMSGRRQRKRDKFRSKKWEPQHFVKIPNCSPKPARPLQGIWKGICSDMSLNFYLISYDDDDIGGISCRKIGDSSKRTLNNHHAPSSPIFWASSSRLIGPPFSVEEDHIYKCRMHLQPRPSQAQENRCFSCSENGGEVSGLLCIISSTEAHHEVEEGRIWQYGNGTFGFGFLRDDYVVDMKRVVKNGQLLDVAMS